MGCHSLLQGIFPIQRSNPGLPHCRCILYQLSHKGSPRILEWVAFPFSRGSSQPRDRTQVSLNAGGFFYQLRHQGSRKESKGPVQTASSQQRPPELEPRPPSARPPGSFPEPHAGRLGPSAYRSGRGVVPEGAWPVAWGDLKGFFPLLGHQRTSWQRTREDAARASPGHRPKGLSHTLRPGAKG